MNKNVEDNEMITGDGAYIKQINRGIILREIIKHQSISRAELAKITGLNKATISVQVADLLKDELITETEQIHHAVGRRPIMLSINRSIGYVLGIDLDYHQIQYTVCDLGGNPVATETVYFDTDRYEEIVDLLINHIRQVQEQWSNCRYGLIGAVVGIHGSVSNDETINFVPKYQWKQKQLKQDLSDALDLNIMIENNANLSAYAEKVYQYHGSTDLVTIILTSGIGAGIIIDGKLQKGFHGFAGEMGHMIISPNGKSCKCGNKGCWELYASETVLINQIANKLKRPNLKADDIQQFIADADPVAVEELQLFIKNLSIGLNNVINLYNPEVLVITSDILKMYPETIEEIKNNLRSSVSQYRDIFISDLGNHSCVMGACAMAIQHFLEVPELFLTLDGDLVENNNEMKIL